MRYNAVAWTPETMRHTDVVQVLIQSGLSPAGCLLNDVTAEGAARIAAGYDESTRRYLLDDAERPVPILLSADRTVAVEVSDLHGFPAVRMRSFLADGCLVETQRRWDMVPPWPRRLAAFRRFTTVEREMTGSDAPGRTLAISDRAPAGQLEEHRRHVATASAERAAAPIRFPDMESVAAAWTAAFEHERATARRADTVALAGLMVLGIALSLLIVSVLSGLWSWVAIIVLAASAWWAAPGLILVLRRWTRRGPAFALGNPTT